jgi:hypothetical protein
MSWVGVMEPKQVAALSLIAELLVSVSHGLDSMGHHRPAAQVESALLLISEILNDAGLDGVESLADLGGEAGPGEARLSPEDARRQADALLDSTKVLLQTLGIRQVAEIGEMALRRLRDETTTLTLKDEHDDAA